MTNNYYINQRIYHIYSLRITTRFIIVYRSNSITCGVRRKTTGKDELLLLLLNVFASMRFGHNMNLYGRVPAGIVPRDYATFRLCDINRYAEIHHVRIDRMS